VGKERNAITARVTRNKRVLRCSIDPGVELNRRQRKVLEEYKASDRRPHVGMAFIAGGARYRENWDEAKFGANGDLPNRLHKTPAGTYFWLVINDLSGANLRQDGSHRAFHGDFMAPIYCVSCGRADMSADRLCTKQHRVPLRLLRTLEIAEPSKYEARLQASTSKAVEEKEGSATIDAAPERNGGWVSTVTFNEPVKTSPRNDPGPIEKLFGAILTFLWNRVKLLVILTLLGIAAGGR
jgi:hypothetical protein